MHPGNQTSGGKYCRQNHTFLSLTAVLNLNRHSLVIRHVLVLLYLQAHDETEIADSQLLLCYLLFGQSLRHHLVLCDDVYTGRIVRKEIKGVEIQDREEREKCIK